MEISLGRVNGLEVMVLSTPELINMENVMVEVFCLVQMINI